MEPSNGRRGQSAGSPVLVIGAFDSTGQDGLPLATRTLQEMGLETVSAITLVSWPRGKSAGKLKLPRTAVAMQIDGVARGRRPAACLVGALGSSPVAGVVLNRLVRREITPVILQPLLVDFEGTRTLPVEGIRRLREALPRIDVVVAGAEDARILAGIGNRLDRAFVRIIEQGAKVVLVRGENAGTGFLYDGSDLEEIPWPGAGRPSETRVAAAAAGFLARGHPADEAVRRAICE